MSETTETLTERLATERVVCVNVADLVDPDDPQGRTYRQINAAMRHGIPLGSLVEDEDSGIRLFVVLQGRDCDQTPLYWLAADPDEPREDGKWQGGYPEHGLRVVRVSR